MELHPLAQDKGIGQPIFRHFPAFSQIGNYRAQPIDQVAPHQGVVNLAEDGRGATLVDIIMGRRHTKGGAQGSAPFGRAAGAHHAIFNGAGGFGGWGGCFCGSGRCRLLCRCGRYTSD